MSGGTIRVHVNLNDIVYVTAVDSNACARLASDPNFIHIGDDEYSIQLWALMAAVGPECYNGNMSMPIKTSIQVKVEKDTLLLDMLTD